MALRNLWLYVVGVFVVTTFASLGGALLDHAQARTDWEQQHRSMPRISHGEPRNDYDPGRSDRAYQRSRIAWGHAGASAPALVLAIIVLLGSGARRAQSSHTRVPAARSKLALSTLLDGALLIGVGALCTLDDGESAAMHALTRAAPVVSAGLFALPLSLRGRTGGLSLASLRCPATRRQAAIALVTLPLALLLLPGALFYPPLAAAHLHLAGLKPMMTHGSNAP